MRRKEEEAYAGRGGTGPVVALPSTLFELGGGYKKKKKNCIVCESLQLTGRKMYTSANVSRNARLGANTP